MGKPVVSTQPVRAWGSEINLFPAEVTEKIFPVLLLLFQADEFFCIRKRLFHPGAELLPLIKLVIAALEVNISELSVIGYNGPFLQKTHSAGPGQVP